MFLTARRSHMMNTPDIRTKRKAQSGQTLVEFAIALPLLATMLFAIIQWGFLFNGYMTLRHAANVTARSIALANGAVTNATSIANAALGPMLSPASLTSVSVSNATVSTAADSYSVKLTYTMDLFFPFVVPGTTSGTKTLTAGAVYRKGG
jgi:Flp pilus assembly protein TadG